ncbi:MAG: hypothetical protein RBG13Loki_2085 [Promethearchaeota archaeon CR_4]|nr:MAG: hypothetical protein RBG13Loki_2085 [Candidatus Lokiarchaeota archaeon CR_4]
MDDEFYDDESYYDIKEINRKGLALFKGGRLKNALECFAKVCEIGKENRDLKVVAVSLINIGNVHSYRGDKTKALECYKAAREIDKEIDATENEAGDIMNIGNIFFGRGEINSALGYYEEALDLLQWNSDKKNKIIALCGKGNVLDLRGNLEKAMEYYNNAASECDQIEEPSKMGNILSSIGNVHLTRGDLCSAKEYFEKSLTLQQEDQDVFGEAFTLKSLGNYYHNKGHLNEAFDHYKRALDIYQTGGYLEKIINTANNILVVVWQRGDLDKALGKFKLNLEICEKQSFNLEIPYILLNLGAIYSCKGQMKDAEESYEQARKIFDKIGNKLGKAYSLLNIGKVYYGKEEISNALQNFEESLSIFNTSQCLGGKAAVSICIGSVYVTLDNFDRALSYFNEASLIYTNMGAEYGEAIAKLKIGSIHRYKNELDIAMKIQEEVYQSIKDLGYIGEIPHIYNELALTLFEKDEKARPFLLLKEAIVLSEKLGYKRDLAISLLNYGLIELQLNSLTEAETSLNKALNIFNEMESITIPEDFQKSCSTLLGDKRLVARLICVALIGIKKMSKQFDTLISLLNDKSHIIRKFSLVSLNQIKDKRSIDYLINALNDKVFTVKRQAAKSLREIGNHQIIDIFIQMLNNNDEGLQLNAAMALAEIPDSKAVLSLIAKVKQTTNKDIKGWVIRALGQSYDPRALDPLLGLLENTDENIRAAAALAIGRLEEKEAIPALLKRINDGNSKVRRNCIWALERIGFEKNRDQIRDNLVKYLNDDTEDVRNEAAIALGKLGDVRALNRLEGILKENKNNNSRYYAALALGKLKIPRSIEILESTLKQESDTIIKNKIIASLIDYGKKEYVESYYANLRDHKITKSKCQPTIISQLKNVKVLGIIHGCECCIEMMQEDILKNKPDILCVELDIQRYIAINNHFSEIEGDLKLVFEDKKTFDNFPLHLEYADVLKGYQSKDTYPGQEMIESVKLGKKLGIPTFFIDIPIRDWIEPFKKKNIIEENTEEHRLMMKQRDVYMCRRIKMLRKLYPDKKIYAIVGRGHLPGMTSIFTSQNFVLLGIKHILDNPSEFRSLDFQNNALNLANEIGDIFTKYEIQDFLFRTHLREGRLIDALKKLIENIELAKKLADDQMLNEYYFNLSQLLCILAFEEQEGEQSKELHSLILQLIQSEIYLFNQLKAHNLVVDSNSIFIPYIDEAEWKKLNDEHNYIDDPEWKKLNDAHKLKNYEKMQNLSGEFSIIQQQQDVLKKILDTFQFKEPTKLQNTFLTLYSTINNEKNQQESLRWILQYFQLAFIWSYLTEKSFNKLPWYNLLYLPLIHLPFFISPKDYLPSSLDDIIVSNDVLSSITTSRKDKKVFMKYVKDINFHITRTTIDWDKDDTAFSELNERFKEVWIKIFKRFNFSLTNIP